MENLKSKVGGWLVRLFTGLVAATLVGLFIWWMFWVNFVDVHEYGYAYNKMSGTIRELDKSGWVVVHPWVEDIHKIDRRPKQVQVVANGRILNTKLVKFNPKGLMTFIAVHGRHAGQGEELYEILKSYAFNVNEGKDCDFLIIDEEVRKKEILPELPNR